MADLVQIGVEFTHGGFDAARISSRESAMGLGGQRGEWSEQERARFDQQDAQFDSERCDPIAARLANTLYQTFGAELVEVITQLGQSVIGFSETVPPEEAFMGVTAGPV